MIPNDPNVTHKVLSTRTSGPAEEFVGEAGKLFYNEQTGELRISDGIAVGGKAIYFSGEGAGPGAKLILIDEHGTPATGPLATALMSLALGDGAAANYYGGVVQSAGAFTDRGDAQAGSYVARNITTDNTWTSLYLDGASEKYIVPSNTAAAFTVTIIARRTNTSGSEGAVYELKGGVDRASTTASTRIIGNSNKTVVSEDNPTWDVRAIIDTSTAELQMQVRGETAKTVRWVAQIKTVEVKN